MHCAGRVSSDNPEGKVWRSREVYEVYIDLISLSLIPNSIEESERRHCEVVLASFAARGRQGLAEPPSKSRDWLRSIEGHHAQSVSNQGLN